MKSESMLKLARLFTPMHCSPMKVWQATTHIRSLTMPFNTWMDAYTQTALRISGRC